MIKLLLPLLIVAAIQPLRAEEPFDKLDLLIRGGTIVDGTGEPPMKRDIGIVDGRIVLVAPTITIAADEIIDSTGLLVAPGFINVHDHSVLQDLGAATNLISQGVTTTITNADGSGPTEITGQLRGVAEMPLAINFGAFIGFNSVWQAEMGMEDPDAVSAAQISRMQDAIEKQLAAGAWGVTAGLDYKPGSYADIAEVTAILAPARKWRTIFSNHDRVAEENGFSSMAGMSETLDIASATGMVPIVTHIKAQGQEQGTADAVVNSFRLAGEAGSFVATDIYPYVAGMTGLHSLLVPGWALEGGRPAMLQRFGDIALRKKITASVEEAIAAKFKVTDGIFIVEDDTLLTNVMTERRIGAGEAVLQLLEEEPKQAVLRFGIEDDVDRFLRYEGTMIACDCGASEEPRAHPRFQGTFPRILGRYVRERQIISLTQAIRKMSGLPADMLGLIDRGYIAAGMHADLVIFDPQNIVDHATFEEPHRPSEGILTVLVSGAVTWHKDALTGQRAGEVLYRPSFVRTIVPGRHHRMFSGTLRDRATEIAFTALSADEATGVNDFTLRYRTHTNEPLITSVRVGKISAIGGWLAVVGIVEEGLYQGKAFEFIVDDEQPNAKDGPSAFLIIDGKVVFKEAIHQ